MPGASGRPGPDDGDGAVRVVKDTVADRAQESAADEAGPTMPAQRRAPEYDPSAPTPYDVDAT